MSTSQPKQLLTGDIFRAESGVGVKEADEAARMLAMNLTDHTIQLLAVQLFIDAYVGW